MLWFVTALFVPGIALFDSSEKLIAGEGKAGELPLSNDSFAEMSLRYAILCSIIVDILDGSAYLFDKEAPERISASERLAHIEELIASVEKDGVEMETKKIFWSYINFTAYTEVWVRISLA